MVECIPSFYSRHFWLIIYVRKVVSPEAAGRNLHSYHLRNLVKGGQAKKMTPLDETIPDDVENQ